MKLKETALKAWALGCASIGFMERNHKKIIGVLMLMNAFGIIAPKTATALRDAVLSLAL